MNHCQKLLITLFIPVTLLIIVLDYLFPSHFFVDIIKFTTMSSLLLISLYIKKRHNEQLLLLLPLFFAITGDLFFVLLDRYLSFFSLAGISCFTLSYLSLTAVFSKAKPSRPLVSIITAIPVLSLVIPVVYLSYHQISQSLLPFGIIFLIILGTMAWSAIKVPFGSYYSPKAAKLMAAAGILILICDSSVILSLFGPVWPKSITMLLKTITWGSWIPAWALIAVLIAEDNLLIRT